MNAEKDYYYNTNPGGLLGPSACRPARVPRPQPEPRPIDCIRDPLAEPLRPACQAACVSGDVQLPLELVLGAEVATLQPFAAEVAAALGVLRSAGVAGRGPLEDNLRALWPARRVSPLPLSKTPRAIDAPSHQRPPEVFIEIQRR